MSKHSNARQWFVWAAAAAVLAGSPLVDAGCPTLAGHTSSTPDGDFTLPIPDDGTVTHTKTGLMWKRCPQGRSGAACATGSSVRYSWQQALQQAVADRAGPGTGYTDWRLPSRIELMSIIDTACKDPTINTTLLPVAFPMIPPNNQYWSSTPGLTGDASGRAWTVQYNVGMANLVDKTALNYVRLVRGGAAAHDAYDRLSTVTGGPTLFDFTPQTGHNTSVWVESDIQVLSGITGSKAISVAGGEYSINGAAYTTTPGTVVNGDDVQVQLLSSFIQNTAKSATLTINGVNFDFTVTTGSTSEPDPVAFNSLNRLVRNAVITSNTVTVTGLAAPRSISISGGINPLFSIDGGAWTNTPTTISNGQKVAVRHTTSGSYSTTTTAYLSVNGRPFRFDISTERSNRTPVEPALFVIPHQVDVAASTAITSAPVTITGIGATARNISVSAGGSYRYYNGTTWSGWLTTSGSGVIGNNYIVEVQRTSSATAGTTVATTLSIGSRSVVWNITTAGGAAETAELRFIAQNSVPRNARVRSEIIQVTDLSASRAVSIAGASGEYRISRDGMFVENDGVVDPLEAWTSVAGDLGRPDLPGILYNNSFVQVRLISNATAGQDASTTLTVNGRNAVFKTTSGSQLEMPGPFYFEEVYGATPGESVTSNTGTVTGLSNTATLTVSNATYSKNGSTSFIATGGSVVNNDTVALRMNAASCAYTQADSTLYLNGYPYVFTVWTGDGPIPSLFTFPAKTNQCPGVNIDSDPSPGLQCISGTVPIAVSNGWYSKNSTTVYTNTPATVANTDVIRARVVSSATLGGSASATVSINSRSFPFSVTTRSTPSPDDFTFPAVTNACPSTQYTSDPSPGLSGTCGTKTITVSGGSYSINSTSTFVTGSGSVVDTNVIRARLTTSGTYGATSTANVSINGLNFPYSVTSRPADVPAALEFPTKIAAPSALNVFSAGLNLSGMCSSTAVPISISGTGTPEFSINDGTFRTTSTTIQNTNKLEIQLDAGPTSGDVRTGTVNINGSTHSYSVLTVVLTRATAFNASTIEESLPVTISGMQPSPSTASITAASGSPGISVSTDGGTNWSGYATSQSVSNGDQIKVRLTTGTTSGGRIATFTINGSNVSYAP